MNYTAMFEEQVALTPKDMCQQIDSLNTLLEDKLRKKLEGKCSRHGFVVPGTLKVLSRSMGTMERGRFTGSILFHIQSEADVLNPPEGAILEGIVIRKNKMGMYVSYMVGGDDAIRVIIPRDLHIGDETFEQVEIGEKVKVEIKKSRFQINDPYILSVGMFLSTSGKPEAELKEVPTVDDYGEVEEPEATDDYGETKEEELEEAEEGEEAVDAVETDEGDDYGDADEAAEAEAKEEE